MSIIRISLKSSPYIYEITSINITSCRLDTPPKSRHVFCIYRLNYRLWGLHRSCEAFTPLIALKGDVYTMSHNSRILQLRRRNLKIPKPDTRWGVWLLYIYDYLFSLYYYTTKQYTVELLNKRLHKKLMPCSLRTLRRGNGIQCIHKWF